MGCNEGRAVTSRPGIGSAACGESLVSACRAAREAADVPRFGRFSEALERCLQFVTTLQYTEANTQHFNSWYQERLLGGFHASRQDGELRIDYTQHAVCALTAYLSHVAQKP